MLRWLKVPVKVRTPSTRPFHAQVACRACALLAAVLIAFVALTAPAIARADTPPIAAARISHTIRFGEAITFSLDAGSVQGDIAEIQARFRPQGPGRIWSYTYAAFTPGRTVHAEFEIPTGGAAYYPPGVRFDVYCVVTDTAGNRLETPVERVDYLNPRFDWRLRTEGAVTAVTHDLADSAIDSLLAAAAERLPDIVDTVGTDTVGEYRAILFGSRAEAEAVFPPISEAARRERTFAGFAYDEYGLFVLERPHARTFVHELTHLVVADATRSPLARPVPAWLNEGLAVFFETGSSAASRSRVERAAKAGDLLPLSAMNATPGKSEDIAVFYPQSGSFVGYLIERHGRAPVAATLAGLGSGVSIDAAVVEAFGSPLVELDADYREWMGAPPVPTASPDPTSAATAGGTPGVDDGTTESPDARPDDTGAAETEDGGLNRTVIFLALGAAGLVVGAAFGRWRRRGRGR